MGRKFIHRAFASGLLALLASVIPHDAAAQVPAKPPVGGAGESCRVNADCATNLKCVAAVCRDPAASTKPAVPAPPLGGPGETCRAKADCAAALKCVSNVCRDPMEGASCTARADCGTGELTCVESKCVRPATPPTAPPDNSGATSGGTSGTGEPKSDFFSGGSSKPPEKPPAGSGGAAEKPAGGSSGAFGSFEDEDDDKLRRRKRSSSRSKGTEGFEGFQPHAGLVIGGGPSTVVDGGTSGGFLFALKGGVLIDRIELGLELSPMTFLPIADFGGVVLQMNAYAGYHIPIYENFSWPLRGGIGFTAVNNFDTFQARFDLVGISAVFGPVLLDVHAPSIRVFSDFDSATVLHFMFGIGGSILPFWF